MTVPQPQGLPAISDCMIADRYRLRRSQQRIKQLPEEKQTAATDALHTNIVKSAELAQRRKAAIPTIEYPDLPVSEKKDEIKEAILNNQVVIVAGETGSGKTTQLPKICLQAGRGIFGAVAHTQPRRIAARSVAARIAEEMDTDVGKTVGCKIRFSDHTRDDTLIKLMTDGILLAEIQQDRYLNQYDTIIIDEAHERSLNIDFILGYLKRILPKRPDLKVIITSATIDPERFAHYFSGAPIISVSGRTYPVEIRYRPLHQDDAEAIDQGEGILAAVKELSKEGMGDILVFLSGEREIRDTQDLLQKAQLRSTEIVPLFARLSAAEQNRIFQPHSGRRIVLATNVAETSLTVPGIRYVIDPGTARISRYSVRSKVQRLPIEPVSQASAKQRSGRCGRVAAGICIRLYDEQDWEQRPAFTDPEILRTNLASVIVQMIALGLGDISQFAFIQPPEQRAITDGIRLLEELGAVTGKQGKLQLTDIGRWLAKLPVDPRYARMLLAANETGCLNPVQIIVAALSVQDPRERPLDAQQKADEAHAQWRHDDSDFLTLLQLWQGLKVKQTELSNNQFRKWCRGEFLNYLRVREWQDILRQLQQACSDMPKHNQTEEADYQQIHQAICSGLLSHCGHLQEKREFLGARNSRFTLFPASGLAKSPPKWVMVAELQETSRLFGRIAAKIQPGWLEHYGGSRCKYHYSEPHWSKKQGCVQATESVTLYGLTIVAGRRVNYSQIDPAACRELFVTEALVQGNTKLRYDFLTHNLQQIAAVEAMEDKSRRRDLLVDEWQLQGFYDEHLPQHVCSEAGFKKWWRKQSPAAQKALFFDPAALVRDDATAVEAMDYPDLWNQGNVRLPLQYKFEPGAVDDGVSLLVPLSLLNQLQPEGFEWVVPGLREELLVFLIKALPKNLRRNFVPAPDYAKACLAAIEPDDGPLLATLQSKLFSMTGVKVDLEHWQSLTVPEHLTMNFVIQDSHGKTLAQGRDLLKLQGALKGQVKSALQAAAEPGIERSDLTDWDFGPLPQEFVQRHGKFEVKAYPALVAQGKKVHVKLFEQAFMAQQAHLVGLRQLVLQQVPSPIKYLQQKLPNKAKLGLYFNPFGQIAALIDDCISATVDHMLGQMQSDFRDPTSFKQAVSTIAGELNDQVLQVAQKVEKGLTLAHGISKTLKGKVPLDRINAHGAIKAHLDSLVFPGCVTALGVSRLEDWNRYLQGLQRRNEKLAIDVVKDRQQQLVIDQISAAFSKKCDSFPAGRPLPDGLEEARWMIEELRVSLFAQQLGTTMPISSKRVQNYLDKF